MMCDCALWQSKERILDAVNTLIVEGFIDADQGQQCHEALVKFAAKRGWISYDDRWGVTNKAAFTSAQQRTIVEEYLRYESDPGVTQQERKLKRQALGVTTKQLYDWTRKYVPDHKRNRLLAYELVTGILASRGPLTHAEIVGLAGLDYRRTMSILKHGRDTGRFDLLPGRKPRRYAICATTQSQSCTVAAEPPPCER